ncbi:hypothetical protein PHLCEN_2v10620 [Hermanssonia centrifuga]|uniref:Uncharacterized protein n=1 Tax=Hermanssonia centrifuga TaxID=98765 RepID=A0A2R6NMU5_9APHY|nr:hypothetical protein PHLCEN_2v10620 [Hermanssonia centrifuga]
MQPRSRTWVSEKKEVVEQESGSTKSVFVRWNVVDTGSPVFSDILEFNLNTLLFFSLSSLSLTYVRPGVPSDRRDSNLSLLPAVHGIVSNAPTRYPQKSVQSAHISPSSTLPVPGIFLVRLDHVD